MLVKNFLFEPLRDVESDLKFVQFFLYTLYICKILAILSHISGNDLIAIFTILVRKLQVLSIVYLPCEGAISFYVHIVPLDLIWLFLYVRRA